MFRNFFAAKLADLGYPNQHIEYSLSYRLGDGVSFFGRIDPANIQRLADRLLVEQSMKDFGANRAVIRKAIKIGAAFEIEKVELGNCSRCESMYVTVKLPASRVLTPYQQAVIEQFVELLRKDIVATASVLTTLGYALVDSTPAEPAIRRVFMRRDFVVLVKELPDPDFDPIARFGKQGKTIADMLTLGSFRHYGLKVEIRPRLGGEIMGEATLMGVVEDVMGAGMGSAHRGTLRALMREASLPARRVLATRKLRAA